MTYNCIERLEGKYYGKIESTAGLVSSNTSTYYDANYTTSATMANSMFLSSDPVEAKIKISMAVTFIAGLIQVKIVLNKFRKSSLNFFYADWVCYSTYRFCHKILVGRDCNWIYNWYLN